MGRWTDWQKIRDKSTCYHYRLTYDGPACYELGIGKPRAKSPEPVYVGETDNEKRRISLYATNGAHLKREIKGALRAGFCLYFRGQALPTKKAAKSMQDRLVAKWEYPWNRPPTGCDEDVYDLVDAEIVAYE